MKRLLSIIMLIVCVLVKADAQYYSVNYDKQTVAAIGPLIGAAFHRTAQLAQADYRNVQFLCHDLQGSGNLAYHNHTVIVALSVAGALHQLKVVDDDQAQVV